MVMNIVSTLSINKTSLIILVICSLIFGCDSDDTPNNNSLKQYFDTNPSLTKINELIACASGGQSDVFTSDSNPISVFFLPEGNAANFRYFETDNLETDNNDFSAYNEVDLNHVPVFGGFLRYFEREPIQNERWSIVTYEEGNQIHYSNPIRLKFSEKRTELNNSLLTFDQSQNLSPIFTWQDGLIDENVIYFHAITDANGNLLSGTYTTDRTWQFYDLSNVVLNIRDVTPSPALLPNQQYQYTMLAVSIDNWVNLIIQHDFNTF